MPNEPVPYIPLKMVHDNMTSTHAAALPQGYSLRLFRPGEENAWADIVTDAGEFETSGEALAYFAGHFGGHYEALPDRCFFLLDGEGRPVGTATGWFMDEDPDIGRLHWVAVARAHQGKGLCRPLVAAAMNRMVELGHTKGLLTTQPQSWKGIKVYLGYGWKPFDDGSEGYETGWAITNSFIRPQRSSTC